MSRLKSGITARQAQAAKMFVLGRSLEEISQAVQRTGFTVGSWLKEEAVLARIAKLREKLELPDGLVPSGIKSKSEEVLREALFNSDTPLAIRVKIAMYFQKIEGREAEEEVVSPQMPTGFSEEELERLAGDE